MPIRRFRLYVDETGTDATSGIEHTAHRFLSLTGVAIADDHLVDLRDRLAILKARYFRVHPDDPPVIIHRNDILRRTGPFQIFGDRGLMRRFGDDWLDFLAQTDFTAITVFIDKLAMSKRDYWAIRHPYHYAMELLVEKFTHFLERNGAQGDIMPEERRGKKDQALQAAFEEVRQRGTRFVSSDRITAAIPSANLKFRGKMNNVAGLQIADSVSYVSEKHIKRHQFVRELAMTDFELRFLALMMDEKYDRSPHRPDRIWGYGIKVVP